MQHSAAFTLLVILPSLLLPELSFGDAQRLSLANVYHVNVDIKEYWVSEKLDGVRAYWDGNALYSRQGNRFNPPSWFISGFPSVALDGELWMGRGRFEQVSGTVRRALPDEAEWRRISFMVFDLPSDEAIFDERLQRLQAIFKHSDSPSISLVEQFRVTDETELMTVLNRVVAEGGEGLMLRKGHAPYRAGRSDDLLKLKTYEDAEAVVIAHLPGKGKYTGMLGSLLVETPDGHIFKLGTGFSDHERQSPPLPGATVTYKFHGKTRNGIPRFASFLRVRDSN